MGATVLQCVDADQGAFIHLQGHMGAETEFRIAADRPVLDAQREIQAGAAVGAVVPRAQQVQLRATVAQMTFDLLHGTRWCHFLQLP